MRLSTRSEHLPKPKLFCAFEHYLSQESFVYHCPHRSALASMKLIVTPTGPLCGNQFFHKGPSGPCWWNGYHLNSSTTRPPYFAGGRDPTPECEPISLDWRPGEPSPFRSPARFVDCVDLAQLRCLTEYKPPRFNINFNTLSPQ